MNKETPKPTYISNIRTAECDMCGIEAPLTDTQVGISTIKLCTECLHDQFRED